MSNAPGASTSSRKTWKSRWVAYGRTSYGGNPVTQQTLPSFFLYATPYVVIPVFAVVAVVFIALGVYLVLERDRHYEVRQTYSDIHRYQYVPTDPNINVNQGIRSFVVGNTTHTQGTRTRVTLEVLQTLKAPVYLYYTLENFFQNFRGFHNGHSRHQMKGAERISGKYKECMPFERPGLLDGSGSTKVHVTLDGTSHTMEYQDFTYNPCGIAPWSMFNDTFVLYRVVSSPPNASDVESDADLVMICNTSDFGVTGEPLGQSASPNHCRKKGISWPADEQVRFKSLKTGVGQWSLRYPYPNDDAYLTNGWYANEPGHRLTDPQDLDLQVWVRSAAVPNFRKLLRIIDVDLEEGQYVMEIDEFFDVTTLQGAKGFLLNTASWVGKESGGLGIAFLVVGSVSFIVGVSFAIEYLLRWRTYEHTLREPKARWYVFDPNSVEMRLYYTERTKRYDKPTNGWEDESDG
ncbi:hypothetical protein DQ04_05131050 [Trypanosoma grayi]|uniref:hypothetical protein n=1 Tax=Trypanosoma grayi TaxID=71804 RepID=UPI0004F49B1D|nr:hypothetical protein DQ04_05131050 [Trypanosoma grayi]KEG09490.1 hypothetical protein DQ04_05131050 [Trypanosoma grayi]